jgi:ligand-binding sensor domain-containing protein
VALNAASPLPAELSEVEIAPVISSSQLTGTIYSLYFSEDQTLWVSTVGGVASYKDEQLTIYKQGESLPATPSLRSLKSTG